MGRLQALLWGNEKPLFDHFRQLGECIGRAGEEFLALAQDFEHSKIHADKLHEIEHECDAVVESLFDFLNDNTFLPIDHDDIEQLARHGDEIVDLLWGAANRIGNIYELTDPDDELPRIAEILLRMTQETKNLFIHIKDVRRKKNLKADIILPFREQESNADDIRDKIANVRFKIARQDPAGIPLWIAWSEVIQHLEHATDRCVDVTDVLKRFPRKYS
ncbi:MAG: DUF47 family protein [Candidatus Spechtbacteria bacterium]|nr:DUF47 family protein [Candidatus Spechtbacteria bacterium]